MVEQKNYNYAILVNNKDFVAINLRKDEQPNIGDYLKKMKGTFLVLLNNDLYDNSFSLNQAYKNNVLLTRICDINNAINSINPDLNLSVSNIRLDDYNKNASVFDKYLSKSRN